MPSKKKYTIRMLDPIDCEKMLYNIYYIKTSVKYSITEVLLHNVKFIENNSIIPNDIISGDYEKIRKKYR